MLITNLHLAEGNLMMVQRFNSFSHQMVTLFGTLQESDAVLEPESKQPMTIRYSCKSQIGKREQGSALTYASAVEMHL